MDWLAEFLIGIPIAIIEWSFIEYLAHRYLMHRRFSERLRRWYVSHTILHHGRWFKRFAREPDPAAEYVSDGVDPMLNVVATAPGWLLFGYFVSWPLAIAFAVVGFLHGVLWTACHHEMHWPRCPWWSRTRAFRLMRLHHRIHHTRPGWNYAALFPPWADRVFGTRKTRRLRAIHESDSSRPGNHHAASIVSRAHGVR